LSPSSFEERSIRGKQEVAMTYQATKTAGDLLTLADLAIGLTQNRVGLSTWTGRPGVPVERKSWRDVKGGWHDEVTAFGQKYDFDELVDSSLFERLATWIRGKYEDPEFCGGCVSHEAFVERAEKKLLERGL
jgi:hypothetical protein